MTSLWETAARQYEDEAAGGIFDARNPATPGDLAAALTRNREAQRPHFDLIDRAFLDIDAGTVDRVMVWLPPQTGKTQRAEWGLLWWLQRHQDHHLVYAAHAKGLAQRAGRHIRDHIVGSGDRLGMRLAPGTASQTDWEVPDGGGMYCVGVKGSLTGRPGDLGVVDDPFKDRAQAESPLQREGVHDWWSSVFLGRLSPGASVLIIGHRWHPDDLQGRVLDDEGREEDGGRWRVIHLPALALDHTLDAEPGDPRRYPDPLGRAPGEPLPHPKIAAEDHEGLLRHWAEKRRSTLARDWTALYQGDPREAEGKIITWVQLRAARLHGEETLPEASRVAVAVDPSGGGDSEAGIVAGRLGTDGRAYKTHDRSGIMSSDRWGREACLLAHETGADRVVFENNYGGDMAGTIIRQAWEALAREGKVSGLPPRITTVHAKRGKVVRADPVAAAIVEGRYRFAYAFPEAEAQWATYQPGDPSPDRMDADVYLALDLLPSVSAGPAVVHRSTRRVPTGVNAAVGFR